VLGFLTPRSLDAIAAQGELLSAPLVVAAFRARGIPAELVDPRRAMVTDDHFGRAEPQPEAIAEAARERFQPLLREGRVPVTGGFVGATREGITTTLGRGGSDYSASLFGAGAAGRRDRDLDRRRRHAHRRPAHRRGRAAHRAHPLRRGQRAGELRRQGAASEHDHARGAARHPRCTSTTRAGPRARAR
jgi:hypothetical protein